MRRPSRSITLTILLLAVPVLSGCIDAAEPTPAAVTDETVLLDGAWAHSAEGLVKLPEEAVAAVAALFDLGTDAFEPTLGVDAEGRIFYATTTGGVAIGFRPGVMRSDDGGATWVDVSPTLPGGMFAAPPETNDPYLYVDPATGRVFQFAMAPILVCGVLSWSDDAGESWTTNPRGCGNTPPWDHQTMVAAAPRGTPTVGYSNVLHQCVNNLVAASCSRSLDGGLTWTTGTPASVGNCGGLHGHLVAAPDGTVYLPKDSCARSEVIISRDDGVTWETVRVSDVPTQGWSDPAMAVDEAGNVYYAFVDEAGALLLSVSIDSGATWSEPVVASPPGVTTHIPALAAMGAGRIALAYPGTEDLSEGYASPAEERDVARWNGYLAVSVDALSASPTFQTTRVNPADDPLVRGPCGPARCPGMTDFIDVVIGPDGRPYAAFVDTCTAECVTSGETIGDNNANRAVMATLVQGPSLRGE